MENKEFMQQTVEEMSISELAEAIKMKTIVLRTNEKEELKVGDRVKIIHYWKNGRDASFDGQEGELIERQQNQGEYKVKLDGGQKITSFEVKKIEKPKAEWTDITSECEFKLYTNLDGFHHINIYYRGIHFGYGSGCKSVPNPPEIYVSNRDDFKIEREPIGNNFKILRRN